MRPYLLPFLLIVLLFTGCREDGETISVTTGELPVPNVVRGTVTSVVINTSGESVQDYSITGLSEINDPNPDGSLTIPSGMLDPNGTVVQVTSPGHWPETRVLMPGGDGDLRETFVLEPKVKAGTLNPAEGGTITLGDNFSVTLPENTVATTEDGEAYDGPIDVYVNHDPPEDQEEMLNSPINALAQLENGEMAALESYGMMDIALETPEGELIVLDEATPAEVRLPLKAATEANAPLEAPFWFLDPDGFWLPDGVATLAPGCYVVFIVASGGYNVDIPHPVTRLCGRFLDAGGFPLTHSPFSVNVVGGMVCGASRVDCNGEWCINVAADTPLAIIVKDPCDTSNVFIVEVDGVPANNSRDLGDIVIDLSNAAFFADVVNCEGGLVSGAAPVEIWAKGYGGNDGQYFAPDEEGRTVVSVVECDEGEVVVQAFTSDFRAASPVYRRTSEDALPQSFVVCGDLEDDEMFELSIGAEDISITELAAIYWPNNEAYNWQVRAAGLHKGDEYVVFFNFSEPQEGAFSAEDARVVIYRLAPGQELADGRVYVRPDGAINLEGTSVSSTGDEFSGNFSTTMNLQNNAAQTVEIVGVNIQASFRINL
ncbi:hypothetical protein [Lewinella sp. W8]|uniref:hypothetical protein n=1 Tax=Lewinella sp. W8 TaxID=2528208 RepID=UPI001067F7D6|nr:hypothetical protein [Lewinella sp. W8]MTB50027.1 hypothetical protein [Lewinella sp. W8]